MKLYTQTYVPEIHMSLTPMAEIEGFPVRPGLFDVHGAMMLPVGVNFTVHTRYGTSCTLLLFHRDAQEPFARLPFPDAYKIGDVYSMIVFGLDIEEFEYAYQIDGPYDPQNGLVFDRNAVLLDPYARSVAGQRFWGDKKAGGYHARVVRDVFDWGAMPQSARTMSDLVIYELHVRGFTYHPSSGVKHPGTFAGLMEKIPYLKELGINAVELMPIFEFDETMNSREIDGKVLLDYWGYNTVGFFAPNISYISADEYNHEGTELKELIKAFHDNGIEVILDVVFNHTAEGNEKGATFCFKGFDNKVYYMLTPDGNYYNFSGCGNTLNCNHPIVRLLILECLRYWTVSYRIDGFRFDLASILGRNEDGSPLNNPPLLELLASDPVLRNVKLIAEAWDAGGLYQVGCFPSWNRWAEWNGRYRDDMRNFLKGDFGMWEVAAKRITGSKDIYDPEHRGENASVNFLTCHDGFTLWDLYSYNQKHNEANGWNNTDGADDNRSWNCGVEGETEDEEVLSLRRRLAKNAFAVLMCSRGTPMYFAGDEFLNSQFGNNNAYCQDNEISWLNWGDIEKNREHFEFCRFISAFRKNHPVLRKYSGRSQAGFPEIQVMGPDGQSKVLRVIYAGRDEENRSDDIICLAVNVFWEDQEFDLPPIPAGMCYAVTVDTGKQYLPKGIAEEKKDAHRLEGNRVRMIGRSVCVLTVEKNRGRNAEVTA